MTSLSQQVLSCTFYVTVGISILANVLLIWLILKKSNRSMKNYSHVLLQATVVDIVASIVYTIVQCVSFEKMIITK